MRMEHLASLVCPACHGTLERDAGRVTADGALEEGSLACIACGTRYPVVRGVPRFVPEQNYASGFGFQWNRHARTQYDSTSGAPISERRFFAASRWPRAMPGERILEVGGGAGRFTEHAAATGAFVASIDYSGAVDANHASNGHRPNVLIVQADVYAMPFPPGSFDRCFCFGVLQHTPDVERAFRALPRMLRPGGHLAVDVYRRPRGLRRLTATKYYVRPFTRRLDPERLYALTSRYVRLVWPVARAVRRIPYLGIRLNWAMLVPDYGLRLPLPDDKLREWAELDLFDMLAPAYDSPQDLDVVRGWFESEGLAEVDVDLGFNGIEGRGRLPS